MFYLPMMVPVLLFVFYLHRKKTKEEEAARRLARAIMWLEAAPQIILAVMQFNKALQELGNAASRVAEQLNKPNEQQDETTTNN